jgi:hypothetical protein
MKIKCPMCRTENSAPLHTDREIRQLGDNLEWDENAVCGSCYIVLRTYRTIALASTVTVEPAPRPRFNMFEVYDAAEERGSEG